MQQEAKITFQKHKHKHNDTQNYNHTPLVLQSQRFSELENCHMPRVLTCLSWEWNQISGWGEDSNKHNEDCSLLGYDAL
jgi:hypothetical protein